MADLCFTKGERVTVDYCGKKKEGVILRRVERVHVHGFYYWIELTGPPRAKLMRYTEEIQCVPVLFDH